MLCEYVDRVTVRRRRSTRFCAVIAPLAAALAWLMPIATVSAETSAKATTSRAARDEAVRAVPFPKLSRDGQAKATAVIRDTSLYRRLPAQTIDCEPQLYSFLTKHPEVVVNIWQLMGITKMSLQRVDATHFNVADGEGTKGLVEYLYSSPEMLVVYSEGTYDGPLYARTVRGKCLLVMRTAYRRVAGGRYQATINLDTFLAVENLGVEILAKTFQPVIGRAADHNFAETAKFVANLSQTAESNEEGMIQLASRLKNVDAATLQAFVNTISEVPIRLVAAQLEASPGQGTASSAGKPRSTMR